MPSHNERTTREGHLLAELAEVEKRIVELTVERDALRRIITRVRQQNVELKDVTRKNSLSRVLIENRIMQALQEAGKPVRATELLSILRQTSYNLKESTFRSYLHRMKEKGVIKMHDRGVWRLAE
ncbi:MAG: winged-helix domain-containing protein [Alphaproteobacteria bacterium]